MQENQIPVVISTASIPQSAPPFLYVKFPVSLDSMCACVAAFACAHACAVVVRSLLTVPVLWRVSCSVGGLPTLTVSAPEALVRMAGAGSEIAERAHSTFSCAPSGAATVLASFLSLPWRIKAGWS